MPLKIHLKKGQKILINGAVIECTSPHNVSLLVKNDAAILRDTDILSPEDAATPASRVYYALQCLYIFPDEFEPNLLRFNELLENYTKAAPSAEPITRKISQLVENRELYKALKNAPELIKHESKVFSYEQERLSKELRDTAAAGESEGN
ncbi:MAG: flagellar biosynthesis repressor FlbT [Rhodospirillales bacterium]|nr:flagellar biosynthesis repressor FlbT [Rhodospirillales bacterium]